MALLYTGLRDGDGSGSATFHLQHLLLQIDIDCLTRKLPATYHNVSANKIFTKLFLKVTLQSRQKSSKLPNTFQNQMFWRISGTF